MEYNVISGDSHIDLTALPTDLFVSRAPVQWKDKVPRVVEANGKRSWVANGVDLGGVGGVGSRGRDPQLLRGTGNQQFERMDAAGLYDDYAKGISRPGTPELRIKDMELDGIDAEVIYGILGVGRGLGDPALISVVYQIYNDFIGDFCKSNPERFAGLAVIPNHDTKAAAGELRRAATLGLRGAEFSVATAVKPLYHPDWDVLWSTAAEYEMPISFHALGVGARAPDPGDNAEGLDLRFRATSRIMFQLGGMEFLPSIIFSGACDRYPNFKFVLGECGVSWIPYILDRMDMEFEETFSDLNLSMKPSDFWHRQGFTTYQTEGFVADVVHIVGEDSIMWGSDYPHPDGVWTISQEVIERELGSLDKRTRRKLTCDNTGKLYGFIK